MKIASIQAVFAFALVTAIPSALPTASAAERWAAIVGSSDRSSVGWATKQPGRDDAIQKATDHCKKSGKTPKSCDSVREVWEGPGCKVVIKNGAKKTICNK